MSHQLNSEHERIKRLNQDGVRRVIRAIEYHGRLGLPLRGHRDSGDILGDEFCYDQGMFRATMQLMCECGDTNLERHLKENKRSNYTSPTSQNEIIAEIFNVMSRKNASEIKESKVFSLLADETSDSSRLDQLCVVIRFLNSEGNIKERSICFENIYDMTVRGIATTLEKILTKQGINVKNIIG